MEPLGATTIFLAVCISCLLFLSAWRKMSGSGKLPPGPVAFPIIGNALQLNMKNLIYLPSFTARCTDNHIVGEWSSGLCRERAVRPGFYFYLCNRLWFRLHLELAI
uniref:Cytochrome P450 family 2 subfamily C member 8 n=1 Tax=Gopherus agassizii TaxID=38772 RepID=A0A452H156_9SAUR